MIFSKKLVFIFFILLLQLASPIYAAELPGMYKILTDKENAHNSGKIKLYVFMEFFCPHCHIFDRDTVTELKEAYKDKLEVEFIAYPFLYKESYLPVEAHELAKDYGKGNEMRVAIFKAIHDRKLDGGKIDILAQIASEIGLDADEMRNGLKKRVKKSKTSENTALAKSYKIRSTPTVVIDDNIKVVGNTFANIDKIIKGILASE